jgi:hypothetical protein
MKESYSFYLFHLSISLDNLFELSIVLSFQAKKIQIRCKNFGYPMFSYKNSHG